MTRLLAVVMLTAALPVLAREATSPDELAQKDQWVFENLVATLPARKGAAPALPFSFMYGGKPWSALLPTWESKTQSTKLDDRRTEHVLTWTDPQSGLLVRCRAVEYHDFPTVEWTLCFKNTGANDTPLIAGVQALDMKLTRTAAGEFVLHHQTGDNCSARSYEPHQTRLDAGAKRGFAPAGGRPTNGAYPFFNVEYDGGGVIAVLGWPGQWAARFERDAGKQKQLQRRLVERAASVA